MASVSLLRPYPLANAIEPFPIQTLTLRPLLYLSSSSPPLTTSPFLHHQPLPLTHLYYLYTPPLCTIPDPTTIHLNMKSITFVIALLAVIVSTSEAQSGNSRYHSAKCLAMKRKCTSKSSRESGACAKKTYARNQSKTCHDRACSWCALPGKSDIYPCSAKNVRSICRAVAAGRRPKPYNPDKKRTATSAPPTQPRTAAPAPPAPKKKPSFQPTSGSAPKSGCVYSGSDKVVVSLGQAPMASEWTRASRGGMTGMVYKKSAGGGIDSPRSSTTMCYKIKLTQSGDYLASAVSAAPHPTEHNDMWISSSKGFVLIRGGSTKTAGKGEFIKAYQNNGGNKMASEIYSVDHDPHTIIIPNVRAGEVVTYCMSGRSSKYEVYKLMVAKCSSSMCRSGRPNTNSLMYSSTKCT